MALFHSQTQRHMIKAVITGKNLDKNLVNSKEFHIVYVQLHVIAHSVKPVEFMRCVACLQQCRPLVKSA